MLMTPATFDHWGLSVVLIDANGAGYRPRCLLTVTSVSQARRSRPLESVK